MALTLQEAAKYSNDILMKGVIETFAKTSPILEMLPFMEISGNAFKYNVEQTLPNIAYRGVNEGYVESAGIINQLSEGLTILGGTVDVDRFLAETRGNVNDLRAVQTEMKSKALALEFTRAFFKGNSAVNANELDGLQTRLVGDQVISAGANGGALTLPLLDELIDAVQGEPDAIFMSKAMRRKLKGILQASQHYIENGADQFGRPVMTYGGIPIRVIETDGAGAEILGFDEAHGTATETASIYAVKFGAEQYVSGLRNGSVRVDDLGLINDKPVYRTLIEFYAGLAVFHPKAAARVAGITK
jgi:hypothetical protein